MRILVIGAGGVGSAAVGIADRRAFFEHLVVADYDPARVAAALGQVEGDVRFSGAQVDASDRPRSSRSSASTGSATSSTRSTPGS